MPHIHTDPSLDGALAVVRSLVPTARELPRLAEYARSVRWLALDGETGDGWWIQEASGGYGVHEESLQSTAHLLLAWMPAGWADDAAARREFHVLMDAAGYTPAQIEGRIAEHEACARFWIAMCAEIEARA